MAFEEDLQALANTTNSSTVTDDMLGQMLTGKNTGSKGGTVITNIPSVAAQNQQATYIEPTPMQAAPVKQAPVDPYEVAFNAVREATVDISKSANYEEKQRKIMDLRTSAMTLVETAHAQATAQAEKMFNLQDLRQRHDFALKQVQKHPELQPQLIAFEKQFQSAEKQAADMAAKLVKANPKLQTFIKTVDGEIQLQSKMAEKGWDRQQRMLDKEDQQKEAAADVLAGMSGTVRETLTTQFPGLKDDVAMAKFITKDGHGKDWLPIIQGTVPPEQYLTEALKGNKPAGMMAMLEQQKRTGLPEAVVREDMNYAQRFVQDKQFMAEEMVKNKLATPEEVKNLLGKGMLDTSKAGQEKLNNYALANVDRAMFARTKNRIDSNLQSWGNIPGQPGLLATPEAAKVYEDLTSVMGKAPNIADFSKAFVADAKTNAEKLTRQALISESYSGALAKAGGGIFHVPMNNTFIAEQDRKLKTVTAINAVSTAGKAGQAVREGFSGAQSLMPLSVLGSTANAVVKPILGSLDEFMQGLLQGGSK